MKLKTTDYGTLPTVIFQRLDVRNGQPTTTHALVFESAEEARSEAQLIAAQEHLRLLTTVDALACPCSSRRKIAAKIVRD